MKPAELRSKIWKLRYNGLKDYLAYLKDQHNNHTEGDLKKDYRDYIEMEIERTERFMNKAESKIKSYNPTTFK